MRGQTRKKNKNYSKIKQGWFRAITLQGAILLLKNGPNRTHCFLQILGSQYIFFTEIWFGEYN